MRGVKRVAVAVTMLAITLFVVVFVLENQQKTTLSMLGWSTAQMPISVFVVLALIGGLLAGPVLALIFRSGGRRGAQRSHPPMA